jgi:hypothetical protein
MNREEILLIAKQSGVRLASYSDTVDHRNVYPHELERFAKLVAAHEREACAKAVEDYCGAWDDKGYALATAIRART